MNESFCPLLKMSHQKVNAMTQKKGEQNTLLVVAGEGIEPPTFGL